MTHSAYTGVTSRQWQQSINGGPWTDISGATGTTCNTGALTNSSSSDITQKYRVKVNGSIYSAEALITVSGDDPPASGNFSLVTNYTYDRAGRLTSVTQNIGTGDVTVAENEYNELGQLIKTKLHKKADNTWLETVNYEYNIRGWVTRVDAGYFKEELHYQKAVTGISNTPQWAGNISAMEWNARNVDNRWHAYAFTYDTLSRLKAGVYRQGTAQGTGYGSTGNNLYNEDYTYDVMGNMKSLNRWLDGEYIDQLTFIQNGNRTSRITDAQSSLGFAGTSDYEYDPAGRLKKDSQKGITKVEYNHLSLPQFVLKGDDSLKYTYDATGRRVKRQYKTEKPRFYVDGAEYEGNRLKFIATPYGRVRKEGDAWHYDYFLKDHLGNIRAVLTSDPNNQEIYTASMEVGASPNPSLGGETAAYENLYFANLDNTRADKPYNYPDYNPLNQKVAKVPGKSKGPAITLKVMAGDTIEISAKAFYNMDNTLPGQGVDIAPIVGSAIAAMTNPAGAVLDEAAQLALDLGAEASQSVALVGLPKDDRDDSQNPQPKSGINFVAYNEKFKVIPENTGVIMVQDNINTIQTLATDKIIIQESGFLEVYANNEAQTPVYFDNLTVSRRAGAALEVNAYYPYGMLNPGLSNSNGDALNAYKYNAKELQDLENFKTGWLDYGARMMDPTVGRWWVPDAMAEKYYRWSPYNYTLANPIKYTDRYGMWVDNGDRYTIDNPEEIAAFMNPSVSGMVNNWINSIKSFLGLNINKEDPKYEEKKQVSMQNVEKTTEVLETATGVMSLFVPGSSLIELWCSVQYEQSITAGLILFAVIDVGTLGEGGAIAKGTTRAAKYSSKWVNASLKNVINTFAPGSKGVKTSTGKTVYKNSSTGIQVVVDDAGNYFRVEDTNLTGKRKYLDLDGTIPNNKVENGKIRGRSQAEYNEVTHFNNID